MARFSMQCAALLLPAMVLLGCDSSGTFNNVGFANNNNASAGTTSGGSAGATSGSSTTGSSTSGSSTGGTATSGASVGSASTGGSSAGSSSSGSGASGSGGTSGAGDTAGAGDSGATDGSGTTGTGGSGADGTAGTAGGSGSDGGTGGDGSPPPEPKVGMQFVEPRKAVDEGNTPEDLSVVEFVVQLSQPAVSVVTVDVEVVHVTTASDDFVLVTPSLTFQPGVTTLPVQLTLVEDAELEVYETAQLQLTNPSDNAELLTDSTAIITLMNDDSGPNDPDLAACTGGGSHHIELDSAVDGENVSFQVLEPTSCNAGDTFPLLLQGHGYSGSRSTNGFAAFRDAGYGVVSFDQRGHGQSGGTIRVLDPDFAGQDLLRALDWMENNISWLQYDDSDNIVLGSMGGSYGGGYQHLIYNIDPKQRLDAMVPEITWHDLSYSLNSGNVVKGGWAAILSGAGDASTQRTDPFVRATLVDGAVTNVFPPTALQFFHYHSLSYHCDNERNVQVGDEGSSEGYTTNPLTGNAELTADGAYKVATSRQPALPKADILYFQGMRDTLFNFNEAYDNYQCVRNNGGDVRLYSYQSGHNILFPNATGASFQAAESQSGLPDSKCGSVDVGEASLAWFNEKLKGEGNANTVLDPDNTGSKVCLSLSTGDDRGVMVDEVTVGGTEFPIAIGGQSVPVAVGNALGTPPVLVPLLSVGADGEVLAGIPTAKFTVSLTPVGNTGDPTGVLDAIIFVGLARQGFTTGGTPDLIDNQIAPVRGLGEFEIDLIGVAEQLNSGDQLSLFITGSDQQYPAGASQQQFTVYVSGTVNVPLLGE